MKSVIYEKEGIPPGAAEGVVRWEGAER
jgi:hypothetical protein